MPVWRRAAAWPALLLQRLGALRPVPSQAPQLLWLPVQPADPNMICTGHLERRVCLVLRPFRNRVLCTRNQGGKRGCQPAVETAIWTRLVQKAVHHVQSAAVILAGGST